MSSVVPKEIALFLKPKEIKGINSVYYVNYRAKNQIRKNSPVEIVIPSSTQDLTLLSASRLHVKARILDAEGNVIGFTDPDSSSATPDVAIVNLMAASLWRQVDLQLNTQIISPHISVNYPYKAIIDTLLSYSGEAKKATLQAQGYFKDEAYNFNASSNTGHILRKRLVEHGQVLELEGPLFLDICQQNRAILNGVEILIKAFPSADDFRLFSPEDGASYQVEILDVFLRACHIKLQPTAVVGINDQLKRTPAIYPLLTSSIKAYTIPSQTYTYSLEDVFNSYVPAELVVAFVKSKAYSGDISESPYFFHHFMLNYLEFSVNGKSVPGEALTPSFKYKTVYKTFEQEDDKNPVEPIGEAGLSDTFFDSNGYINEYLNLFEGRDPYTEGIDITRNDFAGGYSLFVFRLKHNLGTEAFSMPERGYTRLNIRFKEALEESVTLLAYAKFQDSVSIDLVRNVAI